MVRKLFIILLTVLTMGMTAVSQETAPVRWRTRVTWTDNTHGTLIIRALVSEGWHLYGLDMPQGGPRPTRFDFSGSTGVTFDSTVTPSREAISANDPLFDATLTWWDSNVNFSIPFTLEGSESHTARIKINYMVCNGNTCRPPSVETLNVSLNPPTE